MNLLVNGKEYEVIRDFGDTLSTININEYVTDYYNNFDYIVGDWAYGKLRLKGFNKHGGRYTKSYNDYDNFEKYLKNECAYGCKYFILQKQTIEKDK